MNFKNFLKGLIICAALALSLYNAQAQTPPQRIAPLDSSWCNNLVVEFDWSNIGIAVDYTLLVSTNKDFTDTITFIENIPVSVVMADVDSLNTFYFWKVAARTQGNTLLWSDVGVFQTLEKAPDIIYPQDDITCVDKIPTFVIRPVEHAISYEYQISLNPSFNSFVKVGTTTNPTFKDTLPNYNTVYYMRARANLDSCLTGWSSANSFKIQPAPPILDAPVNRASGILDTVLLNWRHTSGTPVSYEVQVANDPNFVDIFFTQNNITVDSLFVDVVGYDRTYYWRVRTTTTECLSGWSQGYSFKTGYDAPVLNVPGDSAVCMPTSLTLDWIDIDADSYRLQVATDPGFTNLVLNRAKITTTEVTTPTLAGYRNYYWRVRGEDTSNTGFWSSVRTFQTTVGKPVLLYPLNDSAGYPLTVTLVWNAAAPGARYQLQLNDSAGFRNPLVEAVNISDTTYTVTLPTNFKVYYWRVKATAGSCESEWSTIFSFRTVLGPPALLSPDDGETNVPINVMLSWTRPTGALTYDITVARDANFTNIVEGRTLIPVENLRIRNLLPNTTYYWRVRAANNEGKSSWSATSSFTTGVQGPEMPELVSPADFEVKLPLDVKLVWTSSERAEAYNLQVSTDDDFKTLIEEENNIADTSFTVTGLQNYTEYFWRVSAVNDSGRSDWTEPRMFRTIAANLTLPVILGLPANNAIDVPKSLHLTWDDMQNIIGYEVQLAKDEDFNNIVVHDSLVYDNTKWISGLEDETVYFWRVRGWNEANKGPWSEVRKFTTVNTISVPLDKNGDFKAIASPNPVTGNGTVKFTLDNAAYTVVTLHTEDGRTAATIAASEMISGENSVDFNASKLSSGVYFIKISSSNHSEVVRIVIAK